MAGRIRPRFADPLVLERAVDNVAEFEVWDSSARAYPTAASLVVYDDNAATVGTYAGTVDADGLIEATVLAADLPSTRAYSASWSATWTLTVDGRSYRFDLPAGLCRRRFVAPVVPGDLEGRHPEFGAGRELDPGAEHAGATAGAWIREAEAWVEQRLWNHARRPWLVIDAWQLREACLFKALEIAFRWARTFAEMPSGLENLAAEYREMADAEFDKVQFRYDESETGKPTDAPLVPARSATILSKRGRRAGRAAGLRW